MFSLWPGHLSPLGSLRHGMDSFGSVCSIEHMLFGGPFWINREVWLFYVP